MCTRLMLILSQFVGVVQQQSMLKASSACVCSILAALYLTGLIR